MDFSSLAFHLEQTTAATKRLRRVRGELEMLRSHVTCNCDFTEQGQHLGCPLFRLIKTIEWIDSKIVKEKPAPDVVKAPRSWDGIDKDSM